MNTTPAVSSFPERSASPSVCITESEHHGKKARKVSVPKQEASKSTESVCPQARGKSGENAIVPGEGSEMVKRLASEKKRRRGGRVSRVITDCLSPVHPTRGPSQSQPVAENECAFTAAEPPLPQPAREGPSEGEAAIVETQRRLPGKEDIWITQRPENHSPETKAVIGH